MDYRQRFQTVFGETGYILKCSRFYLGFILMSAAFLICAVPYYQYLEEAGGSVEGPAWMAVFIYSISSEKALLFLPLFVPAASAALVQEEIKSRFAVFLAGRMGKRNYVYAKVLGTAAGGGLLVISAMMLFLMVSAVWCVRIPDLSSGNPALYGMDIFTGLLCGFLNGAFWSVSGSLAAVASKNSYIAYAVPFILYYVLTTFQERYYPALYFLNPGQWAFPSYYNAGICICMLLFLILAVSAVHAVLIERRVR